MTEKRQIEENTSPKFSLTEDEFAEIVEAVAAIRQRVPNAHVHVTKRVSADQADESGQPIFEYAVLDNETW
jgi:hypothetical protein